jgi:hypothetical protein
MVVVLRIVAVLVAIVSLAGCDWYAKAGKNNTGPWIEAGVSGTLSTNFSYGATTFDANQFVIVLETNGTSITNTSGQALVTLLDGTTVIASRYFGYVNNGGNLVPANPSAVEAWANSYPSATQVKFKIADLVSQPTAEQAYMMATTVYNGEPTASASSSWSTGGGGCHQALCQQH